MKKKEVRNLKFRELRAETGANGERVFSGYAAPFNSRSVDLGGFVEVIAPMAFNRTLREQPDIYALYAHDMRQILGRTKSGTLTLGVDEKGLNFRCTAPDTAMARDLATLVARGDVDGCSFGFYTRDDSWVEDSTGQLVRTLLDVELEEISITPFEAYPATSVNVRSAPREIRAKLSVRADGNGCECDCAQCAGGDCEICSNEDCDDPECRCSRSRSRAAEARRKTVTKTVDGHALTADCFLIVGDPEKTDTWHLPWKFPNEEETKSHLRDALARFDQLEGVSAEQKKAAWTELVKLCKEHDIEVSDDDTRSWKLRAEMRLKLAQHAE